MSSPEQLALLKTNAVISIVDDDESIRNSLSRLLLVAPNAALVKNSLNGFPEKCKDLQDCKTLIGTRLRQLLKIPSELQQNILQNAITVSDNFSQGEA